jgi:outer membrane protein assembly factor BamB
MAEYELKKLETGLFEADESNQSVQEAAESEVAKTYRQILTKLDGTHNTFAVEPIFQNDMMYVASADSHIYAIDTRDAKVIWKFRTGGAITHSPTIYNNILFVGSQDGNLYAIDARNGAELWRFHTGDIVEMKPLVLPDQIVFGSLNSWIYATTHGGKELWKLRLNGYTFNELLHLNGTIFLGATDGRLYSIGNDGRRIWSYLAGSTVVGTPSYIEQTDSIIFSTWDGYVYSVSLDGAFRWKFKCDGSIPSRYHWGIRNGVLHVGSGDMRSGGVYAIDVQDGRLLWKFTTFGRVQGTRFLNDLLICPSMDGNLYALDSSGKLVWKFQADGPLNAPAGCYNGLIFLCSWNGHVYCIDEKGALVWKIYFPGNPADVKQVFSPLQNLIDKFRSFLRFWKPEKAPSSAYETKPAPQLTLGPAAYKMSEPYKSEIKYVARGPYETLQEKKKDWRDPFAR